MEMHMASRMREVRASDIREILKLTQRPSVISFAGGLPAAELFPAAKMATVAASVLETEGCRVLQYSPTEGDPKLREAIAERLNAAQGTSFTADRVFITNGSQQGLDLSGRMFLDDGDVILCESPTYLGAINAFKAYLPRFVEVPTDDEGIVVSELERRLEELERVRLVYVIPSFQNPTGRTWSLERRRAFLEVVGKYGVPVVEDDPYSELCFEGEALPSLKSLDTQELVIYLGTFSKIFCPGLRIAWLIAAKPLVEKYVLLKQGTDLHTSTLAQREIATYMERYDLSADIAHIRDVYRERRDVMLAAMDELFPDEVRYTRPRGGLFLWVELPERLNARDLLKRSLERDVAFVPGGAFYPNGGHENTFRLNFSAMSPERIREGIERLARVLRDSLAEQPA
jgi:2-aminoadipate transaminase